MIVFETAVMPISRFRSFQDTPILHFTLRVVNRMPLLLDEAVPEILRNAWLHSALQERWFVGLYCIQPDHVSLFASPATAAAPRRAWLSAWQEITARKINEATRGVGPLWAGYPTPLAVDSADDYLRLRALMAGGISKTSASDAAASSGCAGMIWQLLPCGEPAPPRAASLGVS